MKSPREKSRIVSLLNDAKEFLKVYVLFHLVRPIVLRTMKWRRQKPSVKINEPEIG